MLLAALSAAIYSINEPTVLPHLLSLPYVAERVDCVSVCLCTCVRPCRTPVCFCLSAVDILPRRKSKSKSKSGRRGGVGAGRSHNLSPLALLPARLSLFLPLGHNVNTITSPRSQNYQHDDVIAHVPPHWNRGAVEGKGSRYSGIYIMS